MAGRPRKQIDQKQFESLCGLQCTEIEIADWFECSIDTINRWCQRTYKANFADVYAKKRSNGKSSLRRMQWRLAEKSAAMAIWLGKQYLGQRDEVVVDAGIHAKDDELSASLREMAKELKSDD